jgi:NTE family protein
VSAAKPERVVLVLSGGGMKSMAHVGVVRALADAGKQPAEIVASSAGALVGALVATGLAYERIVQLVCGIRREDVMALNRAALILKGVGARSLLKPEPLRAMLARLIPVREFGRLAMPLRIVATDLESGEAVVFGVGGRTDCAVDEAVYASMALPLYLPPALIGGRRIADGGLTQVLPLDAAAAATADLVVAADVGPVPVAPPPWLKTSPPLVAAHDRAIAILMAAQRARAVAAWREDPRRAPLVLVEPAVDPYGTFAFDRTVDFIEAGYRAAHAAMAGKRVLGRGS